MQIEKAYSVEPVPEFSSKIDLRFFRHDEKEKSPQKKDEDIELTAAGRQHARGKSEEVNLAQSVAFGSPRRRAQETAGFVMAGKRGDITGGENFEELRAKINQDLGYGSKISVDPKLNFTLEADTPYVKEAMAAYMRGEFMKFVVEQSDALAAETGDTESSTYSRMAASIASIIQKYAGIAPRWDELVKDETKGYQPMMERFFGTHQGTQESFLAKLIEMMKGNKVRDQFVEAVQKKGFDYTEGFEAQIITEESGSEPKVHVVYRKEGQNPSESFEFDEVIPLELIGQIAAGK